MIETTHARLPLNQKRKNKNFETSIYKRKMIKKDCLNKINLTFNPVGWSCAFEISIRAYLQNFKIGEVPLKSVDRLFGGFSTFKPGTWLFVYLKIYMWGVFEIYKKKIKRF